MGGFVHRGSHVIVETADSDHNWIPYVASLRLEQGEYVDPPNIEAPVVTISYGELELRLTPDQVRDFTAAATDLARAGQLQSEDQHG